MAAGGGTPLQLNAPLPPTGSVRQFVVSPDSTKVAYIADQDTAQVDELYVVGLGGGAPTKLNGNLGCCRDVGDVKFSPSSNWIGYEADELTNGLS